VVVARLRGLGDLEDGDVARVVGLVVALGVDGGDADGAGEQPLPFPRVAGTGRVCSVAATNAVRICLDGGVGAAVALGREVGEAGGGVLRGVVA
jgi:hypothetical protein